MRTARLTATFGVILVVLGMAAYGVSALLKKDGDPHITTAIPAVLGGLLLICAGLGVIPKFRMHAMHVAAVLALVGTLGLPMGIMSIAQWIGGTLDPAKRAAGPVQLLMGAPSVVLLVLLAKSFVAARRERKRAPAPGKAPGSTPGSASAPGKKPSPSPADKPTQGPA
ncbi:MAG: hypothetical protein AAF288_08110 [Planctomycetota bacterium]